MAGAAVSPMAFPNSSLRLLDYIAEHHPRSLPGVREARNSSPADFDRYANLFLGWAAGAFGESALPEIVNAFVRFNTAVNLAQARYEEQGRYESKRFADCFDALYSIDGAMDPYLLGVYLTNFMWAHHMDLSMFFERRFLPRIGQGQRLFEIAPGHGGWGLWALHATSGTTLRGFDISPSSMRIATALAHAAGLGERASYIEADATQLTPSVAGPAADACICCFLVEHLENPDALLTSIRQLLDLNGIAFVAGALTAAQVDHIFEFKRESELVLLAERNGFRVLEMLSVGPRRLLPGARFLPRSAALILQKCRHETW